MNIIFELPQYYIYPSCMIFTRYQSFLSYTDDKGDSFRFLNSSTKRLLPVRARILTFRGANLPSRLDLFIRSRMAIGFENCIF